MKARIALCSAFLLVACETEPPVIPELPPALLPVGQDPMGRVADGHPDLGSLGVLSRGPRRMSVEQLERSIEQVGQLPAGSVKFPESLALTLGKPDYLRQTEESLDPSPLFMKFMLDLGALACENLGDLDPQRPVEDRVLTRYEDVDQNINDILLRFTGIENDPDYRARLARVYRAAGEGASGWKAVCIALFTSPEFLLY